MSNISWREKYSTNESILILIQKQKFVYFTFSINAKSMCLPVHCACACAWACADPIDVSFSLTVFYIQYIRTCCHAVVSTPNKFSFKIRKPSVLWYSRQVKIIIIIKTNNTRRITNFVTQRVQSEEYKFYANTHSLTRVILLLLGKISCT